MKTSMIYRNLTACRSIIFINWGIASMFLQKDSVLCVSYLKANLATHFLDFYTFRFWES